MNSTALIDEVQFPSVTMMDRAEAALASQDDLASYAEVLVKKVELGQLEQAERREQMERPSQDGDDRS
jgi:hypothetical protein